MGFSYMNPVSFTVILTDQTADANLPLFKMPYAGRLRSPVWIARRGGTLPGNTTSHLKVSMMNGGTAGTSTTFIGARGGSAVLWGVTTVYSVAITASAFLVNQWIKVRLNETGTISYSTLTFSFNVDYGKDAGKG